MLEANNNEPCSNNHHFGLQGFTSFSAKGVSPQYRMTHKNHVYSTMSHIHIHDIDKLIYASRLWTIITKKPGSIPPGKYQSGPGYF